jgi:hypothetical protein
MYSGSWVLEALSEADAIQQALAQFRAAELNSSVGWVRVIETFECISLVDLPIASSTTM